MFKFQFSNRSFRAETKYELIALFSLICFNLAKDFFIENNKPSFKSSNIYPGMKWTKVSLLKLKDAADGKDFIYFPTYNSSYSQIVSKNSTRSVCFYSSSIAREYVRYVHMTNAFCSSAKAVAKGDTIFWIGSQYFLDQLPTAGYYENIVFLYSPWGNIFAHWLQDCLPALLFIPHDIIEKSKIMISFKPEAAMQWLSLFNINESQILYDMDSWYYADNIYMYYSLDPISGLLLHSFAKLKDYLREKFNVNDIKASRFVFSNKNKNEWRSISNMNEFMEYVRENLPNYKWEYEEWNYSCLSCLAQNIATYKILISPPGSKLYYQIFMNPNFQCGICMISSLLIDGPNYGLGLAYEIWQIGFCNKFDHFARWKPCNIYYGLTSIKRLLHAVENGKWPENTFEDMREVFNLTEIFNESKNNLEKIIRLSKVDDCCGKPQVLKMKKIYGDQFE